MCCWSFSLSLPEKQQLSVKSRCTQRVWNVMDGSENWEYVWKLTLVFRAYCSVSAVSHSPLCYLDSKTLRTLNNKEQKHLTKLPSAITLQRLQSSELLQRKAEHATQILFFYTTNVQIYYKRNIMLLLGFTDFFFSSTQCGNINANRQHISLVKVDENKWVKLCRFLTRSDLVLCWLYTQ